MTESTATVLLDRARTGDAEAFDQLIVQLYSELCVIAQSQRRKLGAAETLNTTAVVHEAYAKLGGRADGAVPSYADRGHFFRVASRAMRDVIVDYARSQRRDKRGGGVRAITLDVASPVASADGLDPHVVLSVDDALVDLERIDAETAQIVELRYFAGLTNQEIADALYLSTATTSRRWTVARAWLYDRLAGDELVA